jgi:hypothetical protein
MKILIGLVAFFATSHCLAQSGSGYESVTTAQQDSSLRNVIFFDDFTNNKNNWTVGVNKNVSARIDGGFYYLTAQGHAYGEAQEVKIDSRKDFEIEARIKIVSGNAEHKNHYSMLFWGREAMSGHYFTFAKDGFVSVQICDGKNQSDCTTRGGSFQHFVNDPGAFNVYMIRKIGGNYSFYVNGRQFYAMPFTPFFGNLIGFGAGRKVTLAIDYLKASYL